MKNGQPHFQEDDDFKDMFILRILDIIYYQLPVDSLLQHGLEYSQIARLLSKVIQEGLVEDSEQDGLHLTKEGVKQFSKLNRKVYSSIPNNWISPCEEHRVPRIGIFDIYLPNKKKK